MITNKIPRWLMIAGGVLLPAVAFAAAAAPTGFCSSWCGAIFGCGG